MAMPTELELHRLLQAMTSIRPLFVLGAGASAPLVPTIAMLRARVMERLRKALPIARPVLARNSLHETVLPPGVTDPAIDPTFIQLLATNGLTRYSLETLVHTELTPPQLDEAPPNYAIFNLVPPGAGILNYNTDGLATRFCGKRHHVLAVHGTVDPSFTEALALHEITQLREFLELTQAFGSNEEFNVRPRTAFLYPEPEPDGFLGDPQHSPLGGILTSPDAVVIVGYTFGKTEHGFSDAASYAHFVEVTRGLQRPLVVVDPSGHDLAGSFGDATENANVTLVPAYWNHLSASILDVVGRYCLSGLAAVHDYVHVVLRRYDQRL